MRFYVRRFMDTPERLLAHPHTLQVAKLCNALNLLVLEDSEFLPAGYELAIRATALAFIMTAEALLMLCRIAGARQPPSGGVACCTDVWWKLCPASESQRGFGGFWAECLNVCPCACLSG